MAVGDSGNKMTTSRNRTDAILARITTLETHVAHQDQVIDELSSVLTQQWEKVNEVAEKLEQIKRSIEKLNGDFGS